jgi:gamma-glutamylputrescine oxidase
MRSEAIEPHVDSYWLATGGAEPDGVVPLSGDRAVEVAVIGGGYTGLSAAYHLAGTHGIEAVLLEANRIGWGASGRNGGICSTAVGKVPLQERIEKWGVEAARRSLHIGVDAVERVRELIASEQIDCEPQPSGYIHTAHRPDRVAELRARASLYRDALGYDGVEFFDRARLERDGHLRGVSANGALWFRDVFGLHPLKYVRGLARAAIRRGAVLHDRTRVLAWSREGDSHRLATAAGTVRARKVIVATNGYTSERLHPYFTGRLLPTTSNIVVTRLLSEAEWRETGMLRAQCYSDTRNLLFYWRRLPDGRMLFGGRAGIVNTPSALRRRRRWLEGQMAAKFPILADVGSDYFWHGNVCLSYDLMPHVGTAGDDPTVIYAMAYLGNGVSVATYCGGLAAALAAGKDVARGTPVTDGSVARFPLPALRRAYIAGAYLYYGLKDRWG